jgi:predicted dithiol-disulfide oxidoreductase (DUF899 family)
VGKEIESLSRRWYADVLAILAADQWPAVMTRLHAERCVPGTRVTKRYEFHGPDGTLTLSDLFGGHNQLIVQHLALASVRELADASPVPALEHFHAGDVLAQLGNQEASFVTVSRAPLSEIEALQRRRGWNFRWLSSNGCDFNYDYHVLFHPDAAAADKRSYGYGLRHSESGEVPGLSVFCRDASNHVFHICTTDAPWTSSGRAACAGIAGGASLRA